MSLPHPPLSPSHKNLHCSKPIVFYPQSFDHQNYFFDFKKMSSNLVQRSTTSKQTSTSAAPATVVPAPTPAFTVQAPSSSLQQRAMIGTANLANLLPTGTLLAFQLLMPIFTNNGRCDAATQFLTMVLLSILCLSCFLACLTDSVKAADGRIFHGLATFKGLWLFEYPEDSSVLPDLTKFKLKVIDWIHATLTVLVFGSVALRDKNFLTCFYPMPDQQVQEVLDIVPVGIGLLCSLLFVVFPTTRHGIGYPVS